LRSFKSITSEAFSELSSKPEAAPVFLFLASSLNVELVYSILKGVTQFGYLTLADQTREDVKQKLSKMQVRRTEDTLQITLTKIKIANTKNWKESKQSDILLDH
jgi:hypothetical protein